MLCFVIRTHHFQTIKNTISRYLAPDIDKIIEDVCKFYNVNKDVVFSSRRGLFNEPRNVAIYLIRQLRGGTLKEAGKILGIEKNSTVSSVVERLKLEIERNKNLNKRIGSLKAKLSKIQEHTPFSDAE